VTRRLPSGTVTLVFTDISGSTALLRDTNDGYAALLADHRRVIREAAARHDGAEVDTQGDAFFIAFARASDALAAAREVVTGLQTGPVRVRIGIHTGEPVLTEEGYVGLDVHLAARIAAGGHGGQILVSQQTRDLVDAADLHDLGLHRLKDVGEVRLFQVGDDEFPPVRSMGRNTVAAPSQRPVGRNRELAELRALIEGGETRLITITGPGGIGKTTLARTLAADLTDRFGDGLWFADLSATNAGDQVEAQVAAAICSHGGVVDHLRGRNSLLVLDNFEQVMEAAPSVAGWLDGCASLVVVVTSREVLRLRAEHEYPLAPLGSDAAVALFEARARAVSPQFRADQQELERLCERLDGMPLALELAATRTRTLTPEQLLSRLDQRFSLLTSGARDVPERQRTMEATVAWSYDLLDPHERELFGRLAVFSGGWTLEAAESVCDADPDVLDSLAAKSLVRFEDGRFTMLETIRAYAASQLDEQPVAAELRRRHAGWFAHLATRAEPELTRRDQEHWLNLLEADEDNLRLALGWATNDAKGEPTGLRLGAALVFFWYLRSRPLEGRRSLEPLLEATAVEDSVDRLRALWGRAFFMAILGDPEAGPVLEEARAMARRLGDGSMEARTLDILGMLALFQNDLERARGMLEASVELARDNGDVWCLVDALGTAGSIYPLLGEFGRARAAGGEALRMARGRGDLQGMRMALLGLALVERRTDNAIAARAAAEEGLEICRRLDDRFFSSYFLWLLAYASLALGELKRAGDEADEALSLARQVGAPLLVSCALEVSAAVARDMSDAATARAYLTEAEALGREALVPGSYRSEALRSLAALDAAEGDTESARARLAEARELARQAPDPWAEQRATLDLQRL
jgi:predicted ATPase